MHVKKTKASVFKVVFKTLLVLFTVLFVLLIASVGILYFNKDAIHDKLLTYLNERTNGDLQYANLALSPLAQFPHVSITLSDVIFKQDEDSLDVNENIIEMGQMHFAFDIMELTRGNVQVTRIKLENGAINLRQYSDGQFNILEAINLKEAKSGLKAKGDSTVQITSISLKQISLDNLELKLVQDSTQSVQTATINNADFSLDYMTDSVECVVDLQVTIGEGLDLGVVNLENDKVELEAGFFFNLQQEKLRIHSGALRLRKAQLELIGFVDFKQQQLDVQFWSNDEDLGLANQILTSKGIDNIKEGNFFLNGHVVGGFSKSEFELAFGAKEITMQLPNSANFVRDLNILGNYYSGINEDRSDARLVIDTIHAKMPNGQIRASFNYENFVKPVLNYTLDFKTNITDLDRLFDLGPVSELKGALTLKDQFSGRKLDNAWIDRTGGELTLDLDSISLTISDSVKIDLIDGLITGSVDSIAMNELTIVTGETDLTINGELNYLREVFFDRARDVTGKLSLAATNINTADFTFVNPDLADEFPYVIKDFIFSGAFQSNIKTGGYVDNQLNLTLDLNQIEAEIVDVLPAFKLANGKLNLHDTTDSLLYVKLSDLSVEIEGASARLNLAAFNFTTSSDSLSAHLTFQNLDFEQLKQWMPNDSLNLNGILDGSIELDLKQSNDSIYQLASMNINADSMYFRNTKDTVRLISFEANGQNITYDSLGNPFANLTADLQLNFDNLKSTWLDKEHLGYDLSIRNGEYQITPTESSIFGKIGKGKYTVSPFTDPPRFQFDYEVKQYAIEDFLASINQQQLVEGIADLNLHVKTAGSDKESLFENLEGTVDLTGYEITVSGFDLDRAIRKYERTQKFNLLDFGAFALTGPIGIAITKGNSYVNLLTLKPGDSTLINEISSQWEISGGRASIVDVALATQENRLAGKGWISFEADSLDFQVAALDANGCPIISQRVSGSREQPELEGIKIIPTLLAPVSNLFSGIVGKDCKVFYEGRIPHPEKTKKKKRK